MKYCIELHNEAVKALEFVGKEEEKQAADKKEGQESNLENVDIDTIEEDEDFWFKHINFNFKKFPL